MILAENVFRNKRLLVMMSVIMCMIIGHCMSLY